MKIDVSKEVLDIYGKPIKNSNVEGDHLKVREALIAALARGDAPGSSFSPDQLMQRLSLSQKIQSAENEIELKSEEISMLKNLIAGLVQAIGMNPIVAALLIQTLDP